MVMANVSSLGAMDNTTQASEVAEVGSLGQVNLAYTVVELLVALLSIVGNLLVIIVFIRYKRLRITTNYYIISLSVADLLVGLVAIPAAIATEVGLPRNFRGCLFMNSILMLLCSGSILSLVAVTVDRYWCILHPLTYSQRMTRVNALLIIVLSWLLAAVIGLLPTMGWNKGRPKEARCLFMEVMDHSYLVFIFFATILAPSAFMAIVYGAIYRAVKRQVSAVRQWCILVI